MVDLIIFSKDRAFQLYTALETINKHMSGINNIFVQFSYSNDKFYKGYQNLVNKTNCKNISFIDETEHGFHNTLRALLASEIETDNIALEVDDSVYYKDIDLAKCSACLDSNEKVGRYLYAGDYKIYGDVFKEINPNGYALVDRTKKYKPDVINTCLTYAFNVSSAIHKKEDVIELLATTQINNPIQLEHKGAESYIFHKYEETMIHTEEVFKQIHLNNFMKRYEEVEDVEVLNNYFLDNEVIDTDKLDIDSMEMDMRWFNGEDIGRFPIFPWEIPPRYHLDIINNRVKI